MGNLVQILTARRLQQAGHTPYALVGGATGMIGDPKDSGERTLNSARHRQGLGRAGAPPDRAVPRRSRATTPRRWSTTTTGPRTCRRSTSCATSASTSRSTGCWRATSCAPGSRPASATPSSATCCCSRWTSSNLFRDHGVTLQFGGSDQWGNLTGGVELIRRADGGKAHAFATPLVDQGRRHQVRQDRGRCPVARPGDDVAVRLPPVLAQRRGREGRRAAAHLHLPLPRGDRGARGADRREAVPARGPEGARRRRSPPMVHGAEETEQAKAAAAALFGGGDLRELSTATRWRPPCARRASHRRREGRAGRRRPARRDRAGQEQGRGAAHDRARAAPTSTTSASTDLDHVPGDGDLIGGDLAGAAPRQEELRRRRGRLEPHHLADLTCANTPVVRVTSELIWSSARRPLMFSESPGSGGEQDLRIGLPAPGRPPQHSHRRVASARLRAASDLRRTPVTCGVREDARSELRSRNPPASVGKVPEPESRNRQTAWCASDF